MADLPLVAVADRGENLAHDQSSLGLLEMLSFSDKSEQLSTFTDLLNEEDPLRGLIHLVQLDDIRVVLSAINSGE